MSIKMAKTQSLSLNPTKISGTCGRLMCCLKYEQDAYEDAVKRCPKQESFVETPDGVGTVTHVNLLREQVKVNLEENNDPPKTYSAEEIVVVRNGKGKRPEGYVAPPPEELAKLRKVKEDAEPVTRLGERSRLSVSLEGILNPVAEKPAAEPPEKKAAEQRSSNRRRRNRNRGGSKSAQPAAEKPAPEKQPAQQPQKQPAKPKQNQPKQNQPKQEQPQAQKKESAGTPAEGAAKKRSNNRRRSHYRKPKPKGDGAAPKAE